MKMTSLKPGLLMHMISIGFLLRYIVFSSCTIAEAWRATKINSPCIPSARERAEYHILKYKQDPNQEEKVRNLPVFRPIPFKRIKRFTNQKYLKDNQSLKLKRKERLRDYRMRRKLARRLKVRGIYSKNKSHPYKIPLKSPQNATRTVVTNVHELRRAVLDKSIELKNIDFQNTSVTHEDFDPFNHEVIKLIEMRVSTNSKPGARAADDNATLALSIEGGGMRGAVSAGMASAIAVLGLCDTFDTIYGSSAGSVIGAYMISRQMCIDVYTDVLTTAKSKFVSKGRLASSLATGLFDTKVLNSTLLSKYVNPAMNISFVLDSIMCPEGGLRPLDVEKFKKNDEKQHLRIVTSTVRNGKMETHCLGSRTMDFFDRIDEETGEILECATSTLDNQRHGLFACLETSMLVPAATGPPVALVRNKDKAENITTHCFDAFCYEPIPYRSAVAEGATHVLAMKTRPDGAPIPTKPGLFEKYFAPMHFDTNAMPEVSKFFENGGQQYIYKEDYLTLDEGKMHLVDKDDPSTFSGILVPPQKILYGVENSDDIKIVAKNRDNWKRAHLFPLSVEQGKPELSALSVDQDEVLEGVRLGFAAAFDLLAPIANVHLESHLDGKRVGELIFSNAGTSMNVLEQPVSIEGNYIIESSSYEMFKETDQIDFGGGGLDKNDFDIKTEKTDTSLCPRQDASELLKVLPGLNDGKMASLSRGLEQLKQNETK